MRGHAVAILALAAALALRFHRLVFDGVSILSDEIADEYYPLASSVFGQIRRGDLPLWSPEILFGYPLAQSVDLHLFSPFSWPHLFWPPHQALVVQLIFIQLVAGFAMYALACRLRMRPAGAATAAILWVSGCPADNLLLISMGLASVPLIPLVILCWDRYLEAGDLRWAALTGGALGLMLLGGHAQFVYWTAIFLVAYLVVVARPQGELRGDATRALLGAGLTSLLAIAVAAVLVMPMTELLGDSIRASLAADQRVHTGTLSLAQTWRALGWTVFCGQAQTAVEGDVEFRSAGVLPVALALLAWGRGRSFDNRLLLLGAGFLVVSLGAVFAPSNWIVKVLPGNNFRYPGRIALYSTLAFVLLAGRAMDRILAGDARRLANLLALGALAALCTPGILQLLRSGQFVNISEGRRDVVAFLALGVALAVPAAGRPWSVLRRALSFAALAGFVVHSQAMTNIVDAWVTGRAWGDSVGFWSHRRGHEGRYPPAYLQWVPRADQHGPTRMLLLDTPWEHDLALLTGHHTPTGLVSLRPARVDRLVYARHVASDQEAPLALTLASKQPLLDLFGVQFLVVDPSLFERHFTAAQRSDSLAVVQRLGRVALVENRTHLPRAFFVAHASRVSAAEEARVRITKASFDARNGVILEVVPGESVPANQGEPLFRPARVTAYESERVEIEVEAPREGWLVLLDRWAPGWSARIDGSPVAILRADYLFRAVRVAPGRHLVSFAYASPLFRRGLVVSACGLGVVLAAAVSLLRSRRG